MNCTLYGVIHVPPQPDSPDHHHVIPQAWQRFYVPTIQRGLEGVVAARDGLWDVRTVVVCPNCHRRIHEAIVRIMHGGPKRRDRASKIALQALDRFTAVGGDLDALRAAGLWGEQ